MATKLIKEIVDSHPFLKVVFQSDGFNHTCMVAHRNIAANNVRFRANGSHTTGYMMATIPDMLGISEKELGPEKVAEAQEFLLATAVNQFIKYCANPKLKTSTFDQVKIFNDDGQLGGPGFNLFMSLLFSGFPYLDVKTKEQDHVWHIGLATKGNWFSLDGKPLPQLRGLFIEINKASVREVYDKVSVISGNKVEALIVAKQQIVSVVCAGLLQMRFDGEFDPELLLGPGERMILHEVNK